MKVKKSALFISTCILLIGLIAGCATVPLRETLPIYNINSISYMPLNSLCQGRGINLEYDTFSRTAILTKDAHKINLMVGDNLVLVDGTPRHLRHPVDVYQGSVVVPYKFKTEILDNLFKEIKAFVPLYKIKKIVIDAGHGGDDPGAIGRTGVREKVITLDIAKRLSNLLKSQGLEVVMTRSTDRTVSLASRVEITNNSKAELFLSIHANANRVRSLSGFEVYYVANSVDDTKRALLAAKESMPGFARSCFYSPSLNLKVTLWDMIYTHSRSESIELAQSLCRVINRDLDTQVLGIKGGRFYILKGVHMPAVLIEVGFLSNPNEERLLKNAYYRQQIAQSIVEGIRKYAQELALIQF